MKRVWQIAAGDSGRDYTDLFVKHDVMFMGPGRFGLVDDPAYKERVDKRLLSSQKFGQVKSFVQRVAPNDIVLLRFGHRIISIGQAVEDGYCWSETFDDVFGWDLQHSRRVIWQNHLAPDLDKIQKSEALFAGRRQIPTFTSVKDSTVLGPIEHLFEKVRKRPLRQLPPPPPKPLGANELGEALFAKGIPNDAVDGVLLTLERLRRLARWYETQRRECGRPTEHEVVAHMVLPIMRALGWSEQLLAVEWNKVDLAAFWGTPTTPDRCVLLCEAKVMGHGLQKDVLSQAIRYTGKLKLTGCKKIMIADGVRLYVFQKRGNTWSRNAAGYLNANKIRTNHIAPADTSAVETIVALTPAGAAREVGG